ncbi:transporter substrate-binding domain-containing protein [Paraglaciecola aquimarina]|uniref:Transporter substrate-binding domain-containing protein n=1 Tax=Paraglaciecola aquimarina TaxID=1235557 RepID=A0ABU3SYT5_9ALTE|nr:transporter substrate-binding domain-containing protein [Paraglaciecola aquimarina]MDU0355160.1 transporter substrate-binding domain-containing protein [Paraglaciecola aquimarina]
MLGSVGARAQAAYRFAVISPGTAPYLYLDQASKKYEGVIVDIVKHMSSSYPIEVTFIDSNRNRIEHLIQQGDVDAFLSSADWLDNTQNLLSSEPIITHKSYIYQLTPFENTKQPLLKPIICTRVGYAYPALNIAIRNKEVQRMDSATQLNMMNMLKQKRCDQAIMNNHNANVILSSASFKSVKIYRSPTPIDSTKMAIFFRRDLHHFKRAIDNSIKLMQANGEITSSIHRHELANIQD